MNNVLSQINEFITFYKERLIEIQKEIGKNRGGYSYEPLREKYMIYDAFLIKLTLLKRTLISESFKN
jgi:hypothetical protein